MGKPFSFYYLLVVTKRGLIATEVPLDHVGEYPADNLDFRGVRLRYEKSLEYRFPDFSPLLLYEEVGLG